MALFRLINHKIFVFDEVYILFRFNFILKHKDHRCKYLQGLHLLVYIAVKQDFVVNVRPNKSLVMFG